MAGKLIPHDPSLSTEQKMSAPGILNLPQSSLTIKEYLFIKFLIIIPQTTLHNSSLVTSPTALTPGITSVPRPRLGLFKTSISFAEASLWNSLPQNINSCTSLPGFKLNLHKYMSENNLLSNLDGFV